MYCYTDHIAILCVLLHCDVSGLFALCSYYFKNK